MSILNDFFGSSDDTPVCSYCNRTDGKLIVAVSDNYGPTHWHHAACFAQAEKERQEETRKTQEQSYRNEMHERYQQ